jgi:hypothetical protein
MNIRYILIFLIIFILNPNFESQKKDKKREETNPYQEYLILLREYRKNCRSALKPFRYDGALTTHFSYKDYDYSKEVEIATIQDQIYRLSFNANGITGDGIKIKIFDKPKKFRTRILLYEKENVTASDFIIETDIMIEELKKAKNNELENNTEFSDEERNYQKSIIEKLRVKKLYIDYVIPATERVFEEDDEGNEKRVITKAAIILAVGYSNI